MNKAQALYTFWSSFAWSAIDEQSAYDEDTLEQLGIEFPYITYESATDSIENTLTLGADLWDRSTSWSSVEEKAAAIQASLGMGGTLIHYDGGALWITRGASFARRMSADTGYDVRRIHITINAEYLSA